MSEAYDVIGYSIANFGKEKNGDSFLFERLEEESLLIAVVADGVSQQPCDWLASQTTCQTLIDHFKTNVSQIDIGKRLFESILHTNRVVGLTEGKCHKMASTLSVVVCLQSEAEFCYANVGDSRIYSLYNGQLEQLTTDNSISRKERIVTSAGARMVDRPILTQVIGQDNISFPVRVKAIQKGEIITLATDGFYDARKAVFNRLMMEFADNNDFDAGFAQLVDLLKILRGDDLTAIAIRRTTA